MANPIKELPSSFGLRNAKALLLPAKGYHYFANNSRFPFEPTVQGHSGINAWWLAECSLLAYEDQQNVMAVLEAGVPFYEKDSFSWFEDHSTGVEGFGIKSKHKDFAILSFRGTEFYRPEDIWEDFGKLASAGHDVIQDSKLWTDTFNGPPLFEVPVIRGFYEQLESIWPQLKPWIESLPETRNLWLTGHSLGAAIAILLAYQFPGRVAGIYTFGSPCPGKQGFADKFNQLQLDQRTFRYVHGNDLIVKGLESLGGSYRHVGTPIILESESRKNLLERVLNKLIPLDITDHAPQYYAIHCWNRIPD